jgi:hypothetical protein
MSKNTEKARLNSRCDASAIVDEEVPQNQQRQQCPNAVTEHVLRRRNEQFEPANRDNQANDSSQAQCYGRAYKGVIRPVSYGLSTKASIELRSLSDTKEGREPMGLPPIDVVPRRKAVGRSL